MKTSIKSVSVHAVSMRVAVTVVVTDRQQLCRYHRYSARAGIAMTDLLRQASEVLSYRSLATSTQRDALQPVTAA